MKWLLSLFGFLFLSANALHAQTPPAMDMPNSYNGGFSPGVEILYVSASVEVEIKGPKGVPIDGAVVVSLIRQNGRVLFANVPKSSLVAEVVAPGYETAKKIFEIAFGVARPADAPAPQLQQLPAVRRR